MPKLKTAALTLAICAFSAAPAAACGGHHYKPRPKPPCTQVKPPCTKPPVDPTPTTPETPTTPTTPDVPTAT